MSIHVPVEFENRLVAFVDILGWSKALESNSAATMYEILEPLRQRGEINNEATRQSLIDKFGDRVNPLMLNVQYGFFSDCFVFSMPTSMGGRIYSSVSEIMLALLNNGFAVRGGISAGAMYHHDNIMFGKALVTSYRIETDEAKFARVMVDESAICETGIDQHDALIKDHLGNWVVDPFPWVARPNDMKNMRGLLEQLFKPSHIIQVVNKKVVEYSGQSRIKDIWRFQAEVCARSFEKYGDVASDWVEEFRRISQL